MSARPVLEAVVFDAGGTLVRLDFEWMSETVTALGFPLDPARLRRGEVEGRRRYDASRGRAPGPGEPTPPLGTRGDTLAYFSGKLAHCGVPEPIARRTLEAWSARQRAEGLWTRPCEGAREAIDACLALGLRLAVVSNSDGRAEMHLRDCGLREGLEFVVDSEIVGVEKPDPRIFRIALDRLGVAPGRAVYVGDILCVDHAGSAAAGMHFTLIDPFGDYAPAGVASVPEISGLAAHLARRFHVPAPANAGTPAPNRAVP